MTTEITEKTAAERAIEETKQTIKRLHNRNRFLRKYAGLINQVGVVPTGYGMYVDFDHLKHWQVMQVMLVFPGKWEKSLNEQKIDYVLRNFHGYTIRCWAGEPPPSCRIVEQTVHVPEKLVPAHDEVIRKLVCSDVDNSDNIEQGG